METERKRTDGRVFSEVLGDDYPKYRTLLTKFSAHQNLNPQEQDKLDECFTRIESELSIDDYHSIPVRNKAKFAVTVDTFRKRYRIGQSPPEPERDLEYQLTTTSTVQTA